MTDKTVLGVSAEDYLAEYADQYCEWVEGVIIRMSPASQRHDALTAYFRHLVDAYLELNPIGRAFSAPFVMRLAHSFREPDIQIVLADNPHTLTDTGLHGGADICLEVVSPESVARDYGDKFAEYEQAGVREYWIIDPLRLECRFHRLQSEGYYTTILPDTNGDYRTPLLPQLVVNVDTLWLDPLPGAVTIAEQVKTMLRGDG